MQLYKNDGRRIYFLAAKQHKKASVFVGLATTKCVQATASSTNMHLLPKHNSIYLLLHYRFTSLAISNRISRDEFCNAREGYKGVEQSCNQFILCYDLRKWVGVLINAVHDTEDYVLATVTIALSIVVLFVFVFTNYTIFFCRCYDYDYYYTAAGGSLTNKVDLSYTSNRQVDGVKMCTSFALLSVIPFTCYSSFYCCERVFWDVGLGVAASTCAILLISISTLFSLSLSASRW